MDYWDYMSFGMAPAKHFQESRIYFSAQVNISFHAAPSFLQMTVSFTLIPASWGRLFNLVMEIACEDRGEEKRKKSAAHSPV